MVKPKRVFVAVEHWDKDAYGTPDEKEKGHEYIDGVLTEGWYKLQVGEKLGHYHIEDSTSKAIQRDIITDDGEVILRENQIKEKQEILNAQLRENTKSTKDDYKKYGAFEALLQNLLKSKDAIEESDAEEEADHKSPGDSDNDLDTDVDDTGDALAEILGGVPKRSTAKAKAKSAAATKTAGVHCSSPAGAAHAATGGAWKVRSGVPPKQNNQPVDTVKPPAGAAVAKKRGRPSKGVVDLTGQQSAAIQALQEDLDGHKAKLMAVKGFDETCDLSLPDELKMFKNGQHSRIREINDVRNGVKKASASASKHAAKTGCDLSTILAQFSDLMASLDTMESLSRLMLKDTADGDMLDKAVDQVRANGFDVSFPYLVRFWRDTPCHVASALPSGFGTGPFRLSCPNRGSLFRRPELGSAVSACQDTRGCNNRETPLKTEFGAAKDL